MEQFRVDDLTWIMNVAFSGLIGNQINMIRKCFRITSKDYYDKYISHPKCCRYNQMLYAVAIPVAQMV